MTDSKSTRDVAYKYFDKSEVFPCHDKSGSYKTKDGKDRPYFAKAPNTYGNWLAWDKGLKVTDKCYGVKCKTADFVVIDIDVKDPNRNGLDTFKALWEEFMEEPFPGMENLGTFVVRTATGGYHVYWRANGQSFWNSKGAASDKAPLNSKGLGLALDVRGNDADPNGASEKRDGGFVLGPGSLIDGHSYDVIADVPIADCPPQWAERILELQAGTLDSYSFAANAASLQEREQEMAKRAESARTIHNANLGETDWDVNRINARIALVENSIELFQTASTFESSGVPQHLWRQQLKLHFLARRPGKTDQDAEKQIRSGITRADVRYSRQRSFLSPTGYKKNEKLAKAARIKPDDYSKALVRDAIDKCSTLAKVEDVAKRLASSGVPEAMWRDDLSEHALAIPRGRDGAERYSVDAVNEAIASGLAKADPDLGSDTAFLTSDAKIELSAKEAPEPVLDEQGADMNQDAYWTDVNLAKLIQKKLPAKLRYRGDRKCWVLYNDITGLWDHSKADGETDSTNDEPDFFHSLGVDTFGQLVMREMAVIRKQALLTGEATVERKSLIVEDSPKIGKVQSILEKSLAISGSRFDTKRNLMHFGNGVWDVIGKVWLDHSPDFYLSKGSMTDYVPGFKSELFDEMLTFTDAANLPYLRFKVFSSLAGYQPRDSGLVIFQGPGRSGKSTFLDTVERICGTYFKKLDEGALLKGSSNNYDLAELEGTRVCAVSEFPDKHLPPSVKKLFNEPSMSVRPIYGAPRTIALMMDFWCTANTLPQVSDTDEGLWRRVRLVKAPYAYVDKLDANPAPHERLANPRLVKLSQADKDELDKAMVAWAMEEAPTYEPAQQEPPASAPMELEQNIWRGDTDAFLGYIDEHWVLDTGRFMTSADAHAAMTEWSKTNNYQPMNPNTFGNRLNNHSLLKRLPIVIKNGTWGSLDQSHFQPAKPNWKDMDTPWSPDPASYSCRHIQGVRFRTADDLNEPRISSILFGRNEEQPLTDEELREAKIARLEAELNNLRRIQAQSEASDVPADIAVADDDFSHLDDDIDEFEDAVPF